jgi:predicted nucleic acid-binding protein
MPEALLDTNVLVHAAYRNSPSYPAAAAVLDRGLRRKGLYCVAPQNLNEFMAVVTRGRFVEPAMTPEEAAQRAEILYRSRRLRKIYPSRGTVLRSIREGRKLRIAGPAWYDLFLAVTMREAGVNEIITENIRDFVKFPFIEARPIRDT